jgi:hypothetical protein
MCLLRQAKLNFHLANIKFYLAKLGLKRCSNIFSSMPNRRKSKPPKSESDTSEEDDILPLRERIGMTGMGRGLLRNTPLPSSSGAGRGLLRNTPLSSLACGGEKKTMEQRCLPGKQEIQRARRPAAEKAIRAMWNIGEDESGDDGSEEEDETVDEEEQIEADDSTESEPDDFSSSSNELEANSSGDHSRALLGKDGTSWKRKDLNLEQRGRMENHNVFTGRSGCTAKTLREVNADDYTSAFHILFDGSMLRHIVKCTEKEAQRQLKTEEWKITIEEMEAFIGLLYIRGVCGASRIKLDKLCNKKGYLDICIHYSS